MRVDEATTLRRALAGRPAEARALVGLLLPVVKARTARILSRRQALVGPRLDEAVNDLSQEVFAILFAHRAHVLRQWKPERGASLRNFVGLVTEREVATILRSRRKSPFTEDPTDSEGLDAVAEPTPSLDARSLARDELERILDELRARLSPEGLHLFYALIVEERDIAVLSEQTGLEPNALYVRRSRLRKLIHQIRRELAEENTAPGQENELPVVHRGGQK